MLLAFRRRTAAAQEPAFQVGRGQRPRQQKSLCLVTAALAQPFQLTGPLDALGRHRDVEAFAEREDCACDGRIARRTLDIVHERLVDLDAVRREAGDVRQRGVAGAEIVERNAATEPAQPFERGTDPHGILDQQRFGYFNFDQRSRHARRRGFRLDDARRVAMQQLLAGYVDRDGYGDAKILPFAQLPAGGAHDPAAQVDDQTALFGDFDEADGGDLAVIGVAPAQEPFHAHETVVREPELRLVLEREQVVVHRPTIEQLVQQALAKRIEIAQDKINIDSQQINLKAIRNGLKPTLQLFGELTNNGLAGSANYLAPGTVAPTYLTGGAGTLFGEILRRDYPNYSAGVSLNIPLRNRAAKSDYVTSALEERQAELSLQKAVNQVRVDVQNALIGLRQARVRFDSAVKARILQQQTLDADRKKYTLGASTVFQVVQDQQTLAAAQSTEQQSLANYSHARISFDQALGTTLEVNHVSIDEALSGRVMRPSDLPTNLPAPVQPEQKQ